MPSTSLIQQLDAGRQTIDASSTNPSEDDLRAFLAAATEGRLSELRTLNLSQCDLRGASARILVQALRHLYVYACRMWRMRLYA
jgi:hypothetical protein